MVLKRNLSMFQSKIPISFSVPSVKSMALSGRPSSLSCLWFLYFDCFTWLSDKPPCLDEYTGTGWLASLSSTCLLMSGWLLASCRLSASPSCSLVTGVHRFGGSLYCYLYYCGSISRERGDENERTRFHNQCTLDQLEPNLLNIAVIYFHHLFDRIEEK